MNAIPSMTFPRYANAFADGMQIDDLRKSVPAVFAQSAHESLSAKYTFIPTERVLAGLISVALHVKPDKMPELKRETFTA